MSTTAATTAAAATAASSSAACGAKLYEIPIKDAACAVPSKDNYTDVMKECCKVASVHSYDNNCGLYCLAQEQSVGDLSSCLTSHGVKYGDAFCNTNSSATATAKVSSSEATSSATKTGSSASSTSSHNAAAAVVPPQAISKSGLGLLALLFCSTVMGALNKVVSSARY
ncbi:hypothetical protein DTO166G4_5107 [Paecilomyces variotii]|nr:hypothetical protein DTO166G4_5107 [Paecilomyces variotii]KAJ9229591.1 hypothetical protein DTO166G5_7778 [Paecilomyces variotii]KAJ9289021.1 hypothetical protein DTO021C3_3213 [Paecilomyces variotii]KAJ9319980.1 hypothetical protein DTO027B3_8993 [Paecilomyces variotii]KAJ9327365.1 hypothetical protein DTO027B5_8986 [Paecilomyces variotii]